MLDVSSPQSPSILGELEIPGFSSYLHPVSDRLLLGFGQETRSDSKMSLFDVSNPEVPIEIRNFIWKNSTTPLRWDPHALAFVEHGTDQYRFAFPVEFWDQGADTSASGLYLFDLSLDDGIINLSDPTVLTVTRDNQIGYAYSYNQRSVIHGDQVHYVYDHRVWSASWDLSSMSPAQ